MRNIMASDQWMEFILNVYSAKSRTGLLAVFEQSLWRKELQSLMGYYATCKPSYCCKRTLIPVGQCELCAVWVKYCRNRKRLQQHVAGNVYDWAASSRPYGELFVFVFFLHLFTWICISLHWRACFVDTLPVTLSPHTEKKKSNPIFLNLFQSQREPRGRLTVHKSERFWLLDVGFFPRCGLSDASLCPT